MFCGLVRGRDGVEGGPARAAPAAEDRPEQQPQVRLSAVRRSSLPIDLLLDQPQEEGVEGSLRREHLLDDGAVRLAAPNHLGDGGGLTRGPVGAGQCLCALRD